MSPTLWLGTPVNFLIGSDGRQLWLDVQVTSTKPEKPIKHSLCQAEIAKCKQYGQGPPERSTRSTLHGCVIPFVAEGHERLARMADALTSYLIIRQAKSSKNVKGYTPSTALRQPSGQYLNFCRPTC